jgi:hypothetical protein
MHLTNKAIRRALLASIAAALILTGVAAAEPAQAATAHAAVSLAPALYVNTGQTYSTYNDCDLAGIEGIVFGEWTSFQCYGPGSDGYELWVSY